MVPCDIRANLSSTATAAGIATGTELGKNRPNRLTKRIVFTAAN